MIVCGPTGNGVVGVKTAWPLVPTVAVVMAVVLLSRKKLTVPVSVPPPVIAGVTVAVKVTA